MDHRKGISIPLVAAVALAIAVALSMITYLAYVNQSSVAESLGAEIAKTQKLLAERIGYVYWDPESGRLWISNDGSVTVRVKAIYVDGVEAWTGDVELEPGEVKSFQVGYGEVAAVLTEREVHVIKG